MATMAMTVTTARKANDATFMTITVTKIVTLVMTVTTTRATLTPITTSNTMLMTITRAITATTCFQNQFCVSSPIC